MDNQASNVRSKHLPVWCVITFCTTTYQSNAPIAGLQAVGLYCKIYSILELRKLSNVVSWQLGGWLVRLRFGKAAR